MHTYQLYRRLLASVFFALIAGCAVLLYAAPALHPVQLRCENLTNPLGLDVGVPRFSWTLESESRNQFQSAYEIIIGTQLTGINSGKGDVWQSGKISSSRNIQIPYAGTSLKPLTRYYWRVRSYNNTGELSAWSETAWFETGMMEKENWNAKWISDGSVRPSKDEDAYKPDPMPLFRKTFTAKKNVAAARLYVSGLGYYEAYLNGKKVGDHMLDPGWTTYAKEVQYVVYDITPSIQKGENTAGIMLGNGWWNPLPFKLFGRWDLRDYQQTGRPCAMAEIHLRYTDGTTDVINTDATWQAAPGPITRNNVYLGEYDDGRLEIAGWNSNGKQNANWKPVVIVEGPSGILRPEMQPPIRVTRVLKAVAITEPSPGVYIFDMGQNFAGVARIHVKGPAGSTIALRYGEGLFDDGSLNVMTTVTTQIKKGGIKGGPGAPETAWQEDRYTLKGSGLETWSPRFTFHGFRYVEVTGWSGGKPGLDAVEGLRMNSDLPMTGSFSCSNEMLNHLHDVIQWTFMSNVFSVQSDCPGREKMGYGADMVVSAESFAFNYDMSNFYGKSVSDYANEQRPEGGITEIAPFTGIADKGYGDLSGPLGWELAFPYLQKLLYEFYGDVRVIENNYEALKRQLAFLESKSMQGLFYWDISDHQAIDPKPESFSASAFYYHHVLLASEFAGILHQHDDSVAFAKRARQIRNSILREYQIPETGRFDNATQSAELFALWYGFANDTLKTFKALNDELKRHDDHLSTGIFSTKMFFDVMRTLDRNDIAYSVVNQSTFPGWGYMLANDATTLWESWDFPETGPSRNHPMFGSVDEWFYRSLLGINPLSPGFARVQIKPQPTGDLKWARGNYQSVRGTIGSNWVIKDGKFHLTAIIPGNTTAEIWIPTKENSDVTENGQSISRPGIKVLQRLPQYLVVEVGSGTWAFEGIW